MVSPTLISSNALTSLGTSIVTRTSPALRRVIARVEESMASTVPELLTISPWMVLDWALAVAPIPSNSPAASSRPVVFMFINGFIVIEEPSAGQRATAPAGVYPYPAGASGAGASPLASLLLARDRRDRVAR